MNSSRQSGLALVGQAERAHVGWTPELPGLKQAPADRSHRPLRLAHEAGGS